MTKITIPDTADLLARTLQREEDANRAAFRHLRRIEALEAEIARMKEARDEWRDVVCWTDDGEKTVFDWHAGGGHPEGEFALIGLRREMPDGTVLNRDYRATGPWAPLQLQGAKP